MNHKMQLHERVKRSEKGKIRESKHKKMCMQRREENTDDNEYRHNSGFD
jgi:hypothetical protein